MYQNPGNEIIDQYLLREFASGQQLDAVAEAVQLHYNYRTTADDLLVLYRLAFWRTRSWEEEDTSVMEQAVREELRGFWERIGRRVSRDFPR